MCPSVNSRLVYATDTGRICAQCGRPQAACGCAAQSAPSAGDGILRVSREKAGRGGKTVTVVRGAALAPAALQALGKRLKAACGAGGTTRDGEIEIQGDHGQRLVELLQAAGFTVKRAGG